MKFSHSTVEKYTFKFEENDVLTIDKQTFHLSGGHAVFILDTETYTLSIECDWGNYCYRWGANDYETFKQLMCRVSADYLLRKMSSQSVINWKKTKKRARELYFQCGGDPNRTYRTEYKNGDWVFGLLSKLDKYGAEMTNEDGVTRIDVDPETICEFTGFKDKFGKKIFEDDIVKVVTPRQHAVGIVKVGIGEIDGDGYKFIGVYGEIDGKRGEMVARSDENYEVISNIYDTPELLSKGD